MKITEIINEATFYGSECTKDCSGHRAGFAWALEKNKEGPCNSHSPSFNKGCLIAQRAKKIFPNRFANKGKPKAKRKKRP